MLTKDQSKQPETLVVIVDDPFYGGRKNGKKVIFKKGQTVTLPYHDAKAAVSANQAHFTGEPNAEVVGEFPNDNWTNPQIIEYAEKNNIELGDAGTKAEYLTIISEASQ